MKNWIFDDPFHKKGPVLVILVPGMIQPSQSVMFLMKWGCKGHWGHGGCWGCGGHWGCRGSKVWKISTEDFRVIQVLEFSFILMFWKKYWFGRVMKYHIEVYHLFCRRLLRPADVTFFENWWMKLKCPILLKLLATIVQDNSQSFYPSEPFRIYHFTMRHPVVEGLGII